MHNVSLLSEVAKYNFAKTGDIFVANDQIRFNLTKLDKECGFVYLWIECTDQQHRVVYVGMAGKTLKARCHQHQGGFVGSTTGRAHSSRLRAGIEAGKRYEIYARKSALGEILGESGISLVCAEELAFIKKFSPPWNSGALYLSEHRKEE